MEKKKTSKETLIIGGIIAAMVLGVILYFAFGSGDALQEAQDAEKAANAKSSQFQREMGKRSTPKRGKSLKELENEAKAIIGSIEKKETDPSWKTVTMFFLAKMKVKGGHLDQNLRRGLAVLRREKPYLADKLEAFAKKCRESSALQKELKDRHARESSLADRKQAQEKKLADVTLTEEDAKTNALFKYARDMRLIRASLKGLPAHKVEEATKAAKEKTDALVKALNTATVEILYGTRSVGARGMSIRYNRYHKGYYMRNDSKSGLLLRSARHEYLDVLNTYWLDACLPCRELAYSFKVYFKVEANDVIAKLKATLEKERPAAVILRIRGKVKCSPRDSIELVDAELVGEPIILKKPEAKK